jgi:hypothetical protein
MGREGGELSRPEGSILEKVAEWESGAERLGRGARGKPRR